MEAEEKATIQLIEEGIIDKPWICIPDKVIRKCTSKYIVRSGFSPWLNEAERLYIKCKLVDVNSFKKCRKQRRLLKPSYPKDIEFKFDHFDDADVYMMQYRDTVTIPNQGQYISERLSSFRGQVGSNNGARKISSRSNKSRITANFRSSFGSEKRNEPINHSFTTPVETLFPNVGRQSTSVYKRTTGNSFHKNPTLREGRLRREKVSSAIGVRHTVALKSRNEGDVIMENQKLRRTKTSRGYDRT